MVKKGKKTNKNVSQTGSKEISSESQSLKSSSGIKNYLSNKWLLGFLIFTFSFLLYAPSLKSDFVWDDVITIEKQYYKFKDYKIFRHIIPKERENRKANYYRPVIFASIALDHEIWEDNPFGYHLTNSLLFSLSSIVFFFLVLLILKEFHIGSREYIAAIAAFVYIIHPMHVESVSWISGRSDVICTLFFLAAFSFHILSYRNLLFFPAAVLMLLLSFLSKEIAVAFPFVVIAFDLLKAKKIRLKNIYISLIYFVIMALYLFVRGRAYQNIPDFSAQTIDKTVGSAVEFKHYFQSIVVMLNSYSYYFIKLLFPFKFNAFISEVPKEAFYTILSILIFTALSLWTFFSIKFKTGLKAFGIIWFVITLGPSVLVSILRVSTTPLAERYLFLPICGFSLLISYLIYPYFVKSKSKKAAIIMFAAVCLLFIYFNVSRQAVWNNGVSFWNGIEGKSENSAVVKINHGMALIDEKKTDEGLKVLEDVFKTKNKAPRTLKSIASNNIGIAYLNKNQPETAREWFLEGVKYNPGFHKSYFHLALIDYNYARKSRSVELFKKAEVNLNKAIKVKKNYARAYLLLAKIYVAYNDISKAKEYAKNALDFGLEKQLDFQAEKILNLRQR
ncbi:MAG: tetratricopeptide repeat protein [Thermodesulfobacteriota bacterium]